MNADTVRFYVKVFKATHNELSVVKNKTNLVGLSKGKAERVEQTRTYRIEARI